MFIPAVGGRGRRRALAVSRPSDGDRLRLVGMVVDFVTRAREEGDALIVKISLRGFLLGSGPGPGPGLGGVAGSGVLIAGICTVDTGVPATNRGSIGAVNAKEESPSIASAERATGGAATGLTATAAGTVNLGEAFVGAVSFGAGTAIAGAVGSGAGTATTGAGTATAVTVSSGAGTATASAATGAGTAIAGAAGPAAAVSAGAATVAAAASAEGANGVVLLPWKRPNVSSHTILADVTAAKGENRGNPTGSPRTDMTGLPRDRAPMA